MKKLSYIAISMGLVFALASCQTSTIAPLEGIYEKPVTEELTTLASDYGRSDEDCGRVFTLSLSSSDITLDVAFVASSSAAALPSNSYTVASASSAKAGTYISERTTVTVDGTSKNVVEGSFYVTSTATDQEDYYHYDIETVIFTDDDTCYKLSWSGEIYYEPEAPIALTQCLTASNTVAYGGTTLTMMLATDGLSYSFDWTTYTAVISGSGNYLNLELYTADGKLHEGSYTPSAAGGSVTEGTFGIGYDADYSDYGWGIIYNQGTCWFTVEDGAATGEHITSGTVTVTISGTDCTIEYSSDSLNCTYTGAIPTALQ